MPHISAQSKKRYRKSIGKRPYMASVWKGLLNIGVQPLVDGFLTAVDLEFGINVGQMGMDCPGREV
jgi:hypothetical protein